MRPIERNTLRQASFNTENLQNGPPMKHKHTQRTLITSGMKTQTPVNDTSLQKPVQESPVRPLRVVQSIANQASKANQAL